MHRFSTIFIFLLLPLAIPAADPDPADNSSAGSDGPYVFYRAGQVIVKYIVPRDSGPAAITRNYPDKKAVQLTCMIPESKDQFSFNLRDNLEAPPTDYPAAKRLLAISDIEGNFQALKIMLKSAGVIDDLFNWTFGNGDLVLLGDFFDRGLNVTECLWLLYKLDGEALRAGGRLHFILGNHEVLNLEGNTQYVRRKYLENMKLLQEQYKYCFDGNTELGRWLRSKNAVERIGDYVFCHGGISPALAQSNLSLGAINRISRQNLGKHLEDIPTEEAKLIFNIETGIFWYRGLAKSLLSTEEVDRILSFSGGKRIVLGHTLQPDIKAKYDGRVICIDLYHEETLSEGYVKALWVEEGYCSALDSRGNKSSLLSVSFPRKPD